MLWWKYLDISLNNYMKRNNIDLWDALIEGCNDPVYIMLSTGVYISLQRVMKGIE